MEYDLLQAIRAFVFYKRMIGAGLVLWQTALWSQYANLKAYAPAISNLLGYDTSIIMLVAMATGFSLQFYGTSKVKKVSKTRGLQAWSNSASELKRTLNTCLIALTLAFGWTAIIIIMGSDARNQIDYRSLVVLGLISTAWITYIAEVVRPHIMPERMIASAAA